MEKSQELIRVTNFASIIWVGGNENLLLYIARVSNPKNQNSGNTKLIQYLIKHKHWSPFEMANICVEIKTSRAISAQILRHRSFSFQEFSQRYAEVPEEGIIYYDARRQDTKNRQNSIDDLSETVRLEWQERQKQNWKIARDNYTWAVKQGIAKESARMVLPLQTSTTLYMNGTLRSWIHYLQVRTDPTTQLEHRQIAEQIKWAIKLHFPHTMEAMGW